MYVFLALVAMSFPVSQDVNARTHKGQDHYVSPKGTPDGDGTQGRPWDLKTALAHTPAVKPGDTIWLRGGTYGTGGPLAFNSSLSGEEQAPITVRNYRGEEAIIDGGLKSWGPWTDFWGLHFTNTRPERLVAQSARGGFDTAGRGNRVINCVMSNLGGIGSMGKESQGGEWYGNIIYGTGAYDTAEPYSKEKPWTRGSAVYTQNKDGTKSMLDNIIFRKFTNGINVSTEGGWADGFHVEGNIIFDEGQGLLMRGRTNPVRRAVAIGNYTYKAGMNFGWGNARQGDVVVKDNYIMRAAASVEYWDEVTFTGNTIYSSEDHVFWGRFPKDFDRAKYVWDRNTYFMENSEKGPFIVQYGTYPGPPPKYVTEEARNLTFDQWQAELGIDRDSRFIVGRPRGTKVVLRPNRYEPGRAHIAVYNWDSKATAEIDLAGVLKSGTKYEIRDAQNFFGPALVSGTYDGKPITLPLNLSAVAPLTGKITHMENKHTAPEFNAFVVLALANG